MNQTGLFKKVRALFIKDKEYWNSYYVNNPPKTQNESLFAKFVCRYVLPGKTLVDLGCGNGRDSFFFNNIGLIVYGIDASESAISILNNYNTDSLIFICGDFINDKTIYSKKIDYFYSRFTIHAIDQKGEKELIQNVYSSLAEGGYFFIEVRSIHDEKFGKGTMVGKNTYMYDNHYRRFVDINELIMSLIKTGFCIKYAEENKGFAPYKNEDSEIIRIVVTK